MSHVSSDQDLSATLQAQILTAARQGQALAIVGSGSKTFYGRPVAGTPLEVAGHRGILRYAPTELLLTARCGTSLREIEVLLEKHGQMLAFEPPYFAPNATLGGTIACGLSGPRRPWTGSVRDCVLGVTLLNGRGERLRFGGEVMKNVAGFDLFRLMVGALGTLGVLLDVSLKVWPKPERELTLVFDGSFAEMLPRVHDWARRCLPLSGVCHDGERLWVRLSGAEAALRDAHRLLGGDEDAAGGTFWQALKEQRLPFFAGDEPLWRLSLPPAAPLLDLPGVWLIDWGGAQRWLKTSAPAPFVFAAAQAAGGHATLFRSREPQAPRFAPLPPRLHALHRELKRAFDPQGLFNPGRLYPDL